MGFHVSLVGRRDLSREIYRQLRRAILEGRLRPGDRLPSSRELARTLTVSRMAATVAYDRLTAEGFVIGRVGAGTVVSQHATGVMRHARKDRPAGALRPHRVWNSITLPTRLASLVPFDFRSGLPDASLFPHRAWRRLVARALRAQSGPPGGYSNPEGLPALREAIARHVGISRGVVASADDVTITNGTQQALDIIARVLLQPGHRVAVEDPGYPPPRRLFASLGMRVLAVPVDRDGLVVEALPQRIRLVYVTPSHQYPLGVSMTLQRRQALLTWADRNNAAIIEDDYDSEFRFGERPLEPLQTLDWAGRVIYVGSFSKTLLPGLRLGFMVTPSSLREAVQKAKHVTDWHTATLAQTALAYFIDNGGFARHIRRLSRVYRARHELVVKVLTRHFTDYLELIPSSTGLHVTAVARKASVRDVAAIAHRAAETGVAIQLLASFAVRAAAPAGIVLGYGAIATGHIEEGLRRLRKCFDADEP